MDQDAAVLRVKDLSVSYRTGRSWVPALRGFEMEIQAGQIYGLVGESGSGKSTAASAIMRFLPPNGRIEPGSVVELLGDDLVAKSRGEMQPVWATKLSLVPQNPGAALNPAMRVGEQMAEILRLQKHLSPDQVHNLVADAFQSVHLPDPLQLYDHYPHQLSGGQQQRVLIAMALLNSPDLLVLDEPTTSLDVTTEATILDLVENLIREKRTGALYVTHNMGVIAQLCDRVTVLYAGEVMEDASVTDLHSAPLHPYTIGLLNSVPEAGQTKYDRPLATIPGRPPFDVNMPPGCVYAPRCPLAIEICKNKPPVEAPAPGRLVRCHRWQEIGSGQVEAVPPRERQAKAAEPLHGEHETILLARDLVKEFSSPRSLIEILQGHTSPPVRAVDGVTIQVRKGLTFGLVGESGSGKTTLSRMLIGLLEPTRGSIEFLGMQIRGDVRHRSSEVLSRLQMIFQDPQSSLNPYQTIGDAIRRPLMRLAQLNRAEADEQMVNLLNAVNLPPEYAVRFPSELSGGEKQRVAIARAFASDPSLIICDEPVSALDASVQSAVLNLLVRLQKEHDTAYVFISHDLAVVGYLADYVAVMYLGELYEVGYARDLFSPPLHPYTEALISAIPIPDPTRQVERIHLDGVIPSPRNKPTGCAFHTRCPHKIGSICEQEAPPWRDDGEEHHIRCHRTVDELADIQSYLRRKSE